MRIERITTAVIEANYDWTIVRVEGEDGTCGWLIADGYVTVPDGPGIGAEPDLEACRAYARPWEPFFDEPG
jgi:L-alanine-DL-glutamate epimerase-like enolase superfamily enzyme